jgi:CRP-like cAMP-binding protein
MPSAESLDGIPLFAALTDAEREELAPWFEERDVGEGVRLVGEGVSGYSFYVLTKGSAVVTSGETTLRELGAGDFFGEVAIIERRRRTATVTTTAPSTVLVMFGTEFRDLQDAHPGIAARIEEAMRQRLADDEHAG